MKIDGVGIGLCWERGGGGVVKMVRFAVIKSKITGRGGLELSSGARVEFEGRGFDCRWLDGHRHGRIRNFDTRKLRESRVIIVDSRRAFFFFC